MTNTPICDFTEKYSLSSPLRLHMPGHKGVLYSGGENFDVTEIEGADELYSPNGIILKSEENASAHFGCRTFYSAEGSSLCIRAMLYLTVLYAKSAGAVPIIAAARNVHKTFLSAAALLGTDVIWFGGGDNDSYLSCSISPKRLDEFFSSAEKKPVAFYITSPDYLGNTANIPEISKVCRKHGIILIVDNAHGAYLKFLSKSAHPIDLGADICCDSAHKTLPTLTGGAYLHISDNAPGIFSYHAKEAMLLFASTSPSYLILRSLDKTNLYLENCRERLAEFIPEMQKLKGRLISFGFELCGDEPLKVTLKPKAYGYTGTELIKILADQNIFCEFADPDFLVMMFTPEIKKEDIARLSAIFETIPPRPAISKKPPAFHIPERKMTLRDALLSVSSRIPAEKSLGHVISDLTVSCPPAVPVIMCGEAVDEATLECFRYYGIESVSVVI